MVLKVPLEESDEKVYRKEMALLKRLQHPNIVNILGVVYSNTEFKIAMECVELDLSHLFDIPSGRVVLHSLYDLLQWSRRNYAQHALAKEKAFEQIASDSVQGLCYLHRNDTAHRDLKPQNILVQMGASGSINAKLCDFGEARSGSLKTRTLVTTRPRQRGTPVFNAPEVIQGNHVLDLTENMQADIWSLAMVLYCLCNPSEAAPWLHEIESEGCDIAELIAAKRLPYRNPQDRSISELDHLQAVYLRCAKYNPNERPSSSEVAQFLQ